MFAGLTELDAVLMVALILGPSLLAHELFKRLIPVERLARERRRLRRKLHEDQQRCTQAKERIDKRSFQAQWWKEQRDMLSATYTLSFREWGGRVHEQPALRAVKNPYERQA